MTDFFAKAVLAVAVFLFEQAGKKSAAARNAPVGQHGSGKNHQGYLWQYGRPAERSYSISYWIVAYKALDSFWETFTASYRLTDT
jgi:hypothetical protein